MDLETQIRKILDKNRFLNPKEKDQMTRELASLLNIANITVREAFQKGYKQAQVDSMPKPF